MIWPTRLRGLSEANGSWKIICICAAHRAQVAARPADELLACESHRAGRRGRQLQDRPAQRRLAAPGFADQPECFAFAEREADAVDRAHPCDLAVDDHARLDREVLDEVGHLEQQDRPQPWCATRPATVALTSASSQHRSRCVPPVRASSGGSSVHFVEHV